MKVILLQDVKSLGKKGDICDVSDGHGRNFIIPKKLGVEATPKNLNDLKLKKAGEEKLAKEQLEAAKAFAENLSSKQVSLSMKAGEGDRIFGSISSKEIAQAYKDQCDIELDKKKIQLAEPIKSFGVHKITVKLHPQVNGELTALVNKA